MMKKNNVRQFIQIFTNLFLIIWRFITTVSEHSDTLQTKHDSRGVKYDNMRTVSAKYAKISKSLFGWYRFIFNINNNRVDRFQIVCNCSIISIVNNRKNICLKQTMQHTVSASASRWLLLLFPVAVVYMDRATSVATCWMWREPGVM